MVLELRGTPRLGRVLALPVGCLATAAVTGVVAWTVLTPGRWLLVASVSAGVFAIYQFVRVWRLLTMQRHAADDWLRSATGVVVPPLYAWRAQQLCSAHQRRTLGRTLRLIEQMAYERPRGRRLPLYLPAVREHKRSVEALAETLEDFEQPVTPAGMLRVIELVTDGGSPLWAGTKNAPLGDAISTTLTILKPHATDSSHGISGLGGTW